TYRRPPTSLAQLSFGVFGASITCCRSPAIFDGVVVAHAAGAADRAASVTKEARIGRTRKPGNKRQGLEFTLGPDRGIRVPRPRRRLIEPQSRALLRRRRTS